MPTLIIDYVEEQQTALLRAGEDLSNIQWSAVRRFFEERYPRLVNNQHRALMIPWWAFLSERDAFKSLLVVRGISDLRPIGRARDFLLSAKKRSQLYREAKQLPTRVPQEQIQSLLAEVGFQRELLPYQARNVAYLSFLPSGATFSVPGAGKTTEALAYFFLTRDVGDRLLVIAPKNAFSVWEGELPACVPDVPFEFKRLTGGQDRISAILEEDPYAVLISYHQLPNVVLQIGNYLFKNSIYMFIDESHRMKRGLEGLHGSTILRLSHLPKRKLILTGTPMPNFTVDLVSQFNFLYPECKVHTVNVIDKLRSVYVRTTKSELGLSPPRRILKMISMSDAQEQLYSTLASDAARRLHGLSVTDRLKFRHFARCVQHLLQAASNPALLTSSSLSGHPLLEQAISEGLSNKLQFACGIARKWVSEGHKVVIWSTFVGSVEHIAELLIDIGAHFIHGGVATSEDEEEFDSREAKIREFNDPNSTCKVLVANPAACSEAISLHHVCHRAIYVDRNYNAAQYLQSEDRIHRIGMPRKTETLITVLCSPNTIDESVNRRLQIKVDAMRQVLDDPELNIQPFNLDIESERNDLDEDDIKDLRRMLKIDE